jgi:hypothetical protein
MNPDIHAEIAAAEKHAKEAVQKVQRLKNDTCRDGAKELFLQMKLKERHDFNASAEHHITCGSVTKWLGRTGKTPTESLKYFPVPKHPQAQAGCPGCTCDAWADCLRKSGFVA